MATYRSRLRLATLYSDGLLLRADEALTVGRFRRPLFFRDLFVIGSDDDLR